MYGTVVPPVRTIPGTFKTNHCVQEIGQGLNLPDSPFASPIIEWHFNCHLGSETHTRITKSLRGLIFWNSSSLVRRTKYFSSYIFFIKTLVTNIAVQLTASTSDPAESARRYFFPFSLDIIRK